MLKIIKKTFLLASFVFSSVFPMRQVAQVSLANVFAKKQVAQVMLARTLNQSASFHTSLAAKSSVIASIAILAKNIEAKAMFFEDILSYLFEQDQNDCKKRVINYRVYPDFRNSGTFNQNTPMCIELHPESRVSYGQGFSESGVPTWRCSFQSGATNFSSSSSIGMVHQGTLSDNSVEAEEHLSEVERTAQKQEKQEEYFENVKKQVNFISANYSAIVQDKTAELVKSCSLLPRHEFLVKKRDLENRLFDLEKRFEYLKEKNTHVKYIFDIAPTINPYHSHGSIHCDFKENLSDKAYYEVLEAIWLKTDIESIKAAIQEWDRRISQFDQEACDSISSKLANASIDTIEKEITDLTAKKEEIYCFVDGTQKDLNKLKNSLQNVETQLEYFDKERRYVGRWWNKRTINSLLTEQTTLKEQIAQMSEDLQLLKDKQKKCELQIEQAQKIADEKIKIASQEEAYCLQEKLEQQHEQTVTNNYNLCNFDITNCPDPELQTQWADRQEALYITIEQGYAQYDKQYNLTPQTIGFLITNGIDYKNFQNFFGTALQQQFHGETCDIFSQAAILHAQFPYHKNLLTSVVDFAYAAHDANKNHQVLLVSQLLDVDCYLLKLNRQMIESIIKDPMAYAQAAVSGVVHGFIIDNIHMVTHFSETCKGLGKAIYYVLETVAINSSEVFLDYPEVRDKRNAEIAAVLKNLGDKMTNSTGPERLEALFRFGANIRSADKLIKAVGGACGLIRSQAKVMGTLEGVASMLEEQGIAQEVIQAAEKMEVAVQEKIAKNLAAELMEVETQVVKNNLIKPQLIVDTALIEERIAQARQHFSGIVQESLAEIKALAQKYGKVAIEFEGELQNIIIDIEHIFLPEVKPCLGYSKLNNMQVLKDMRITGWHYGYLTEFEKFGLIDVVKKVIKNDCMYIESMWPYGHSNIKKTLFPSCWTREQVVEKILEAMNNIIEVEEKQGSLKDLGKIITGKTIEGIEIEIKLKKNTLQDPWKIATAYVKESYIIGVIK